MKIGFDARLINHPGIGRYVKNILRYMHAVSPEIEFLLYGEPAQLTQFKGARIVTCRAPVYSIREFLGNSFAGNLDVLHVPHFNAPLRFSGKLVLTIHDLIYLKFRESSTRLRQVVARPVIAHAIRNAARIIAVSENTKKDIIELFPAAQEKVMVIPEGVDPEFKAIEDSKVLEAVRKKYKLAQEFIVCVGSLKKHKNFEMLIDAYQELKAKGFRHSLVIVGRFRPREAHILEKIKTSDAQYIGEVPSSDLVALYNMASLLVLPSLYEGFGLVVLEAQACGLPVACSRAASLTEVAGDGALYFDPTSRREMAQAIKQLVSDGVLRKQLVVEGFQNLARFSWEKAAAATLEVYREACSG